MPPLNLLASAAFTRWVARMGGPGLILLGLADNSIIPLPGSMDVLTIWLAAHHRPWWWYYAFMATAGAMLGGYLTYSLARKGGKEAFEAKMPKAKAEKVYKRFERWGFWAVAVPALLPPARVGDEHYLDGGIVNSVPLGRAVRLGATRVFVLQVGRIDRPLTVPRRPWEVARVSFEIARRHRFVRELAELPEGVEAHVLPARGTSSRDDSLFGSRDFAGVQHRIDETYDAAVAYLDGLTAPT